MRTRVTVVAVMLVAFTALVLLPKSVGSQDMEELMKRAELYQEWVVVGAICAYTHPLLEWSESLYDEKELTGEDCAEIAGAVKSLAQVLQRRSAKFDDATIKKEAGAYAKSIAAEADAYIKYFKSGDKKNLESAEKHEEEAQKHLEAIGEYLEKSFEE